MYYRLVKKEEKADLEQAGYPSPENSQMGEGEGDDDNEEKKGESGDRQKEDGADGNKDAKAGQQN